MILSFFNTVGKYKLIKTNMTVVLALSGGSDSVALFYNLLEYRKKINFALLCAHLNHSLRKDSDKDERFVKDLCRQFDIPVVSEKFDVKAYAKADRISIEMAGRKLRYKFLKEVAEKFKADTIAFAHTADDNVETFFLNLIYHPGKRGLCGIPLVKRKFIRPFLFTTKKEILEYLSKNRIKYLQDDSNTDLRFLRNRIRWQLLPFISELFAIDIKSSVLKTIFILNQEEDYLREKVALELENCIVQENGKVILYLDKIMTLHSYLQEEAMKICIQKLGSSSRVTYFHFEEIKKIIVSRKPVINRKIGEIYIFKNYNKLIFSKSPFKLVAKTYEVQILRSYSDLPVIFETDYFKLKLTYIDNIRDLESLNNKVDYFIPVNKVKFPIIIRTKQLGDRINFKKLKSVLIKLKIPVYLRNALPIVCMEDKIIYVPYVCKQVRSITGTGIGISFAEKIVDII